MRLGELLREDDDSGSFQLTSDLFRRSVAKFLSISCPESKLIVT